MTTQTYSDEFLRQRRLYLFLPLLTLPFLTFIYWVLVVKNLDPASSDSAKPSGLQLTLPGAALKDEKQVSKLEYYRRADQDSALWAQQIKRDPYRSGDVLTGTDTLVSNLRGLDAPGPKSRRQFGSGHANLTPAQAEAQVQSKLKSLERTLAKAQSPSFEEPGPASSPSYQSSKKGPEISKLEEMMKSVKEENQLDQVDPELTQLNGMLDKILEIQHPDRVAESQAEGATEKQGMALPVGTPTTVDIVSSFGGAAPDSGPAYVTGATETGFYSLDEDAGATQLAGMTAVIDKTQEIVSGATVQLKLTSTLVVAGQEIPEGTFIYGPASLSAERLKVSVSSLRYGEKIFPVKLIIYDLDGVEGIYIPGALSRTVAKQSLSGEVQGYDIGLGSGSLGAQAAGATIEMGKRLLSRKTRLMQVTLNQGYKVLLRDAGTITQ